MYDDQVQLALDLAFQYALFVAQGATVLLLALVGLAWGLRLLHRSGGPKGPRIEAVCLNEAYHRRALALAQACLPQGEYKRLKREFKAQRSRFKQRPRTFVLEFKGDLKASGAGRLAQEVDAVLALAGKEDQVLVKIESPGGAVAGYGLAASQLKRLSDAGLELVAAVDQVAASGGYLMASVAGRILAAPFAVVGSIGVVASLPNFRRWLDDKKIDFEQITSGEYKRTLSLFGENTDKGRAKLQEEIEAAHRMFKDWVAQGRPQARLDQVATGEWWHAQAALELGLVDQLGTSDDYLLAQAKTRQLISLKAVLPKDRKFRLGPLGDLWAALKAG